MVGKLKCGITDGIQDLPLAMHAMITLNEAISKATQLPLQETTIQL